MQAVAGRGDGGASRGFIRAPARTSPRASPTRSRRCDFGGAIDGELLILREGRVQSFNVLQQRLNRKTVTPKLLAEFPAHLRAYDLLAEGDEDLRDCPSPSAARGSKRCSRGSNDPRVDLSPWSPFKTWDD